MVTKRKPPHKVKAVPLTSGVNQQRLASALALADHAGPGLAASKFGMSTRSIRRYQARLKNGELPVLSNLVQQAAITVAESNRDLLELTFEDYLNRMRQLSKTANHAQAALIFEKLAEAKFTKESLPNGHAQQDSGSGQEVRSPVQVNILNQPTVPIR